MAVKDLSLDLVISDQCPDYVFTDNTDYLPVKKRFKFKFHNYIIDPTPAAGTYQLTQISLAVTGTDLMSSTVSVIVDGAGQIESPENTYNSLINSITSQATDYIAVLNKNGSDDFKDWELDISRFVSDTTESSEAVNVNYIEAGLTEYVLSGNNVFDFADGGLEIEGRNLNLYDPSGNEIDLGQVAQVDTFTLSLPSYTAGDMIDWNICGYKVEYIVEAGKEDRECILEGFLNAYNTAVDPTKQFTDTISAEISGDSIVFTAKTKGVPFKAAIEGSLQLNQDYTYTTTTANVSSFDIPSHVASNVITYQPDEEGGTYDITFTVFVNCTYKICKYKNNNWCASLKQIDCCIQELVLQQNCTNCDKIKGLNEKLDLLRANRDAINIMLVDQYSIADINDLVQSSLSVCKKCKCGCK